MLNANSRGINISKGPKYIRKFCSGGPNISTNLSGGSKYFDIIIWTGGLKMGVQFLSDMQYKHGHGLYFSTIDLVWSGLQIRNNRFSEDNQ